MDGTRSTLSLGNLPGDCHDTILSFLPFQDVLQCRGACRSLFLNSETSVAFHVEKLRKSREMTRRVDILSTFITQNCPTHPSASHVKSLARIVRRGHLGENQSNPEISDNDTVFQDSLKRQRDMLMLPRLHMLILQQVWEGETLGDTKGSDPIRLEMYLGDVFCMAALLGNRAMVDAFFLHGTVCDEAAWIDSFKKITPLQKCSDDRKNAMDRKLWYKMSLYFHSIFLRVVPFSKEEQKVLGLSKIVEEGNSRIMPFAFPSHEACLGLHELAHSTMNKIMVLEDYGSFSEAILREYSPFFTVRNFGQSTHVIRERGWLSVQHVSIHRHMCDTLLSLLPILMACVARRPNSNEYSPKWMSMIGAHVLRDLDWLVHVHRAVVAPTITVSPPTVCFMRSDHNLHM